MRRNIAFHYILIFTAIVLFIFNIGQTAVSAEEKVLKVPSDYKTIQSAIKVASSGDTIKVAAGRYKENVVLKEGMVLKGEGADLTIIDGGGKGNVVEGARGSVIEGFTITNSGIKGLSGDMMDVGVSAKHSPMTIANCRIVGNNAGVRTYFSPSNIVNNIIADNKVYGVYLIYSNSSVKNNIIYNNGSIGIYSSYSEPEFINNTIIKNLDGIYSEVSRIVIKNNIITNNNNAGLLWVEPLDAQKGLEPLISYNLVWGNKNDYVNVLHGKGDISKDPLFASAAKSGFRLTKDSPAIDAGDEGKADNDMDGTRNDIGAYGGPLALKNIPSLTKDVSFAALKIRLEPLAEPDYTAQITWADAEKTRSGKGGFEVNCTPCHGSLGKGDGSKATQFLAMTRNLSNPSYMSKISDERLFKIIKEGGLSHGFSDAMVPFRIGLSDEEVRNIIKYIRSDICKCKYGG